MDTAYDAIQQESLPDKDFVERPAAQSSTSGTNNDGNESAGAQTFSEELNEAFQTFHESAWGSRIGDLWETVRKQGEAALDITKKDITAASEMATKELASLSEQLRTSTIANQVATQASAFVTSASERLSFDAGEGGSRTAQNIATRVRIAPKSTSKMFSVLKQKAQARIEELDTTELSKYFSQVGKDVGEFLKDAVTIDPGEEQEYNEATRTPGGNRDVLFDVPEDIKRQIYTTRLDAQLHALHTSVEPILADSDDTAFAEFAKTFSADAQTTTIAQDLDHYPELRKLMEKVVPEKVTYEEFWKRYYFLREQINQEEVRRKQLLNEAGQTDDNFDWDEDEDEEQQQQQEEEEEEEEPAAEENQGEIPSNLTKASNSTATLKPDEAEGPASEAGSKNASSRPSSESSYDVVSAVSSQADIRVAASKAVARGAKQGNDSEEEDWE
ncbi:hypothetical protein V1525DRAFT_401807 [Lipomyces kononenkoae]|uniref:Uncharacterized protein n=1 Tax=Lipomyces kononenkoae TaxID=34357 RepID=A0ACC3T3M1_LIPKO